MSWYIEVGTPVLKRPNMKDGVIKILTGIKSQSLKIFVYNEVSWSSKNTSALNMASLAIMLRVREVDAACSALMANGDIMTG